MKTISFIFILFLVLPTSINAQIGGNALYSSSRNNYYNANPKQNVVSTDSTFTINVSILLNKEADRYKLILGTSQIGKTPKESLLKINDRIEKFLSKVSNLGVKKDEIYVDFVAQTKIYDYMVDSKVAEQIQTGYEVKKNIIISIEKLDDIEKLILLASDFDIYNVIGVNYMNDNIEGIYTSLLNDALAIGKSKVDNLLKQSNYKIKEGPYITDSFYYSFPKASYREYTAYESSDYDRYSSKEKIILRKDKTFFYEGVENSGFDKVINNSSPKIGIQYVLSVSMTYKFK